MSVAWEMADREVIFYTSHLLKPRKQSFALSEKRDILGTRGNGARAFRPIPPQRTSSAEWTEIVSEAEISRMSLSKTVLKHVALFTPQIPYSYGISMCMKLSWIFFPPPVNLSVSIQSFF